MRPCTSVITLAGLQLDGFDVQRRKEGCFVHAMIVQRMNNGSLREDVKLHNCVRESENTLLRNSGSSIR